MAASNIGSITTDDSISRSDRLLGTEASTGDTKNYKIGDILDMMDTEASTSNTVLFDRIFGYTHGTWDAPITGAITVDLTGAKDGACAAIIWSGSSNPVISGVGYELNIAQGEITTAGTYTIYMHYIMGKFNITFFGTTTSSTPDTTAPTLISAIIQNAAPTNVVMTFSESVTLTDLVDNGFSLSGTTASVFSSISGSGSVWTGVLGTAAAFGETITLDYSSVTGDIVDGSLNALVTFSGTSVTNNVVDAGDVTAPTLSAFQIPDANPDRIYATVSEDFTVSTFGGITLGSGKTVTGVTKVSASSVYFTVSSAYVNGDGNDTFAYIGTGCNLTDLNSNVLASFTAVTVTNNVAGAGGVFDSALYAVSVRKVVSTYSGSCMKVRRASDNTTLDIGFDGAGLVDLSAIQTFCGSSDGFIHTWYNQGSVTGVDVTHATNANHPKIYQGSTTSLMVDYNGKTAAQFTTTNNLDCLTKGITGLNAGNSWSLYMAGTQYLTAGSTNYAAVWFSQSVPRMGLYLDYNTQFAVETHDGTTPQRALDSVARARGTALLKEAYSDGVNVQAYDNAAAGTSIVIPTAGTPYVSDAIRIGCNYAASLRFFGYINEIIAMGSDLEASRATYESDINTYYSIY